MKKKYLNCRFHFVVGFDSIKNINTWHKYKELISEFWFYVFDRADSEFKTLEQKKNYLDNLGKNQNINFFYELLNIQITDISSTYIRDLLKDYKKNILEINKYLNKNVLNYIINNNLYGT